MRAFGIIFSTVFLAELADKTQLAVFGFAGGETSPWIVFTASSLALVTSTLLAVLVGDNLYRFLPDTWINAGVGVLFIGLGSWFLIEGYLG